MGVASGVKKPADLPRPASVVTTGSLDALALAGVRVTAAFVCPLVPGSPSRIRVPLHAAAGRGEAGLVTPGSWTGGGAHRPSGGESAVRASRCLAHRPSARLLPPIVFFGGAAGGRLRGDRGALLGLGLGCPLEVSHSSLRLALADLVRDYELWQLTCRCRFKVLEICDQSPVAWASRSLVATTIAW